MPTPVTKTYSFLDNHVSYVSPSASFAITGNGIAEEGVRVTMTGEKDAMTIGADGVGMHSLLASNAGRVEISLLKESPINAMLNQDYRYQKTTAANWGNIMLVITNPVTGDSVTASGAAFAKQADLSYTPQGQNLVWSFNAVDIEEILG